MQGILLSSSARSSLSSLADHISTANQGASFGLGEGLSQKLCGNSAGSEACFLPPKLF